MVILFFMVLMMMMVMIMMNVQLSFDWGQVMSGWPTQSWNWPGNDELLSLGLNVVVRRGECCWQEDWGRLGTQSIDWAPDEDDDDGDNDGDDDDDDGDGGGDDNDEDSDNYGDDDDYHEIGYYKCMNIFEFSGTKLYKKQDKNMNMKTLQILQGAEWTPFSFYSRSVLRTTATDSANFTCQVGSS